MKKKNTLTSGTVGDIVIDKISKSFGEKRVLRDFEAVFPRGQVSCIMGGSGSGKTTLLNIILGIEKPDGGEIRGLPGRISAVFQEDRLCEDFSCRTNVRITAAPGVTPKEIDEALGALGLGDNLLTPVRNLSGGMKRRVAIARAMLAPGELLIMDEPFRGLDEATRDRAAEYVSRTRAGRTLIAVTHDKDDTQRLGAGRVVSVNGNSE